MSLTASILTSCEMEDSKEAIWTRSPNLFTPDCFPEVLIAAHENSSVVGIAKGHRKQVSH